MKKNEIILGIDPGTLFMGFAVLNANGNKLGFVTMDVLKLSGKKDVYERLELIYQKVCEIIKEHRPTCFAIEAPFFGKNVQSMLKLGRAQGVAIAAAMQYKLPVTEYSPKKVKQSITGNGNADKQQVWSMLQRILLLKEEPEHFDATDALAVALCHHYQSSSPLASVGKGFKGWEDFVLKNPERMK
ncbi:crossover junction endodeoxyribonuclease RuvC [Foetidibacter luteolus]|uniref:crossover junction endodeoxyribonuclease RuvC n=1 Tax=Foetidibacter luteolus TaxID=2608880 RepID=UPI00129B86A8|nr:crossover junction endodeoxyribonuclease RuvC [Foetidibacter luteolus]